MNVDARAQDLGLDLSTPAAPLANYVPSVRTGHLLDRIRRVVRLGGYINAAPGFTGLAPVMNGASDLMVEVFGDAGRHARTTVGVSELPLDAVIEVEAMFEVEA